MRSIPLPRLVAATVAVLLATGTAVLLGTTEDDSPAPRTGSPGRGGTTTSITGTCRKLRMG